MVLPPAEAASLQRDVREGNRHYQRGDYESSREKYTQALTSDPESDIVNFNLGTVLYKEKDYEAAIDHLQKALLTEDDDLKEKTYYNLGNALYQSGAAQTKEDIDQAVSSLEKSLGQYERAMAIDGKDEDAKHNYDFVKKELELLKQQQQQKQDQEKSDESKDPKEQQQNQEEQEEKNAQDQPQQSGQDQEREQKANEQQQGQEEQKQTQEPQSNGEQKSDQGRGQEGKESYNNQQESAGQPQDGQELTPKEAQMTLERYKQTEEPQGLLNVYQRRGNEGPVLKDW